MAPSASSGSGGNRLADSLRVASAGAMQRLSSGSQQLWQGVRRMVDPQAPPPQPPPYHYPASVVQPYPPQQHAPQQPHPPTYTQPPIQPQRQQQQQQRPQSQLSEDEALALALQQQFDLEAQQLAQQAQQAQQQAPAPPTRPAAPTGPLAANLPPVAEAAAGWQAVGPAATPQPHASRPPAVAGPPPAAWPPAAAVPVDRSRCAGCGGNLVSLFTRQPYITALGRSWHPHCLLCAGCGRPIAERGGVRFVERGGQLFHAECHKQRFHPKCDVCGGYVPEEVRAAQRLPVQEAPAFGSLLRALQFDHQCPCKHRAVPHAQTTGCPSLLSSAL